MAQAEPTSERERELERRNRLLEAENKELQEKNNELREKERKLAEALDKALTELAHARKSSCNSSKRPSSDIVKPRRERLVGQRKIGGQPGHPKHERPPLPADEIDRFIYYRLSCCPDCHGPLRECAGVLPNVIQQFELLRHPVGTTEYKAPWYWCAQCQKPHCPMPPEIEKAGLCGPVLTAWIAYLKGGCHASFSTIRKFLRDVLGVRVSRGMLAKVIAKVSAALAEPWEELRILLPLAKLLNVDETGHKENGQRLWTWCFRAREYILFKIAETRGTAELLEMLGADFAGVIGCDFFSSYRCYMEAFGGVLQFCLAHFIREVKFLLELPDPLTRRYGQRLLDALRQLFRIIHERKQGSAAAFQRRLDAQRREILRVAAKGIPARQEACKLADRLRRYGESYFRFITTPGIDPTNNIAEQAIRFVVIDRLVTQGTRSEKGRRWCERIWTIIATCTQQGRSAFHFTCEAIAAYFNAAPTPSLCPAPT
jgi:transposase